jgi:hypothetical protein
MAEHLNEALANNSSRAKDPCLPLFLWLFGLHDLISVILR